MLAAITNVTICKAGRVPFKAAIRNTYTLFLLLLRWEGRDKSGVSKVLLD